MKISSCKTTCTSQKKVGKERAGPKTSIEQMKRKKRKRAEKETKQKVRSNRRGGGKRQLVREREK